MSEQSKFRNELVQELRDIQSKHTYFLLASAGASLGFGVQKLDGQIPGMPLYVGLVGMAMWIISFAFGCSVITGTQRLVSINMTLHNLFAAGALEAADVQERESRKQFSRIMRFQFLQFASLSIGVILFALWRVILIFHRSAGT